MENEQDNAPKRGLKNRHIQIIAIAGTIGTGLFLGAGDSIHKTGPTILLVYLIIGTIMYLLLRAIGEMLYQDTDQHSFLNFVTRYVGHKAGYFTQWTYWLVVIFMAMAELTAVGTYLQLWLPNVPTWVTEPVILVILVLLNTLNAKFFGETEFWFGIIKVAAIFGIILTAIIMLFGQFHYNANFQGDHIAGTVSLTNIFKDFHFAPHGLNNFFAAFQLVMFAFVGMEFIGMTAAETLDPQKTLKKAINQIPIRILFFYIGALLAIMAILNWREIPAGQSPFVMVFQLIGVKWAANIINFVVLTSAGSALNSALFSTSRNLYSLSNTMGGNATKPFTKLSKNGIPLNALLFTALLIFITPFISLIPAVSNAFIFITSVATNLFIVVYVMTLITYLKYRKSKDYKADGFKVPAPKVFIPIALVAFILIFVSLFFFKDTLIPAIGTVVWILVFGLISWMKKDHHLENKA
ncbi:amino acid permease [Lactococcus termiticola]|uniref:Amino acid permease n=1 Tax=Lactococcus termiticola TaxID=2169526 RepID=A0A2R5HIX8_9LACT|nr:amino acid permease [Lactococcus termiticola]GBG96061.1 amino acid permease [Lactococcus termiticola]